MHKNVVHYIGNRVLFGRLDSYLVVAPLLYAPEAEAMEAPVQVMKKRVKRGDTLNLRTLFLG